MDTADLTHVSAARAWEIGVGASRESGASGRAAPEDRTGVLEIERLRWSFRNGFDRVLSTHRAAVWSDPAGAGWQLVKRNAKRAVWRAVLRGTPYFLKYYFEESWLRALRNRLRPSACVAEWNGGMFALRAGIAAARPAGCTDQLVCEGRRCALLVTEALEPACPLNEHWLRLAADDDPRRRRAHQAQLTEDLAALIARAHQAGFEHLDMHAANILVQSIAPGRYRTAFVDLHSARLGVPLGVDAVVRNLAQLNQWFRKASSAADRLRFLRAYVRWRNEFETAFEHGRPLPLTFEQLVKALARSAERHAQRLWSKRDRRIHRSGRYFARIRPGDGWSGMVLLRSKAAAGDDEPEGPQFDAAWWTAQLRDPLRWFREAPAPACKDSHSAAVTRALLPHESRTLPVIVKRPLARNWRRALRAALGSSRSARAWRIGHALLHRGLPTARPLVCLERRVGPLVLENLLVTEAIPGARDLEAYLRAELPAGPSRTAYAARREICLALARHLRRLGEAGFVHRDCKAQNILVTTVPELRLWWIDLDGVRPARRPSHRRRMAALTRLHVSLLGVPGPSRSDRLRLLKAFLASFGVHADWRRAWRRIEEAAQRKLRALERRKAWKRAHYGRE